MRMKIEINDEIFVIESEPVFYEGSGNSPRYRVINFTTNEIFHIWLKGNEWETSNSSYDKSTIIKIGESLDSYGEHVV